MKDKEDSSATSQPLSPHHFSPSTSPAVEHQNDSKEPIASPSLPPDVTRRWRDKAQQNLRNQWSNLASYRKDWSSATSSARSHATSLVNSYLSQRYMNDMELGVLSDMPDIKEKARWKLFKQQESHRNKLLSSYKEMVAVVVRMDNSSRSMRTFRKKTSSSLIQFSGVPEDKNDSGDAGGIPVYSFFSISSHEELAREFVQMFILELSLKRLLVVELLSLSSEENPVDPVSWSDELYPGEFDNLLSCGLYFKDIGEPIHPKVKDFDYKSPAAELSKCQLDQKVLQVYLTTWLAEMNIETYRVGEIFNVVGEEIQVWKYPSLKDLFSFSFPF